MAIAWSSSTAKQPSWNGVLVGVRTGQLLQVVVPDQTEVEAVSNDLDVIGFHVFCLTTHAAGRDAAERMFAPRDGRAAGVRAA